MTKKNLVFLVFSLFFVFFFAGCSEQKCETVHGDGVMTVADLLEQRSLVAPVGTTGLNEVFRVAVICYGTRGAPPGVGWRRPLTFGRPPDEIFVYWKK